MIIAVDFDGTIVEHKYPEIGDPVPGAIEKLLEWLRDGHQIILWTMRSGKKLDEAVFWLKMRGVELWGINGNPDQYSWSESPKAYAKIYIDDAAYGCPLIPGAQGERPMVDWSSINI